MAGNVKKDLEDNNIALRQNIKKLQAATFYILDSAQKKKNARLNSIYRNISKLRLVSEHLLRLDLSFAKPKKANENNELIEKYAEAVASMDKLMRCIQELSNNTDSFTENTLKRNLDNLRIAYNTLKGFDLDMGLSSKDWQELSLGFDGSTEKRHG